MSALIRVKQAEHIEEENTIEQPTVAYTPLNSLSRIVRASWLQRNYQIFTAGYPGVQRLVMPLADIVRYFIIHQVHRLPMYLMPTRLKAILHPKRFEI